MKYFTYEELKCIRYDVLEKHALHTKYRSENDEEPAPEDAYGEWFTSASGMRERLTQKWLIGQVMPKFHLD